MSRRYFRLSLVYLDRASEEGSSQVLQDRHQGHHRRSQGRKQAGQGHRRILQGPPSDRRCARRTCCRAHRGYLWRVEQYHCYSWT